MNFIGRGCSAKYIEGSYSCTIGEDELETLTGIHISESLPEAYKNYAVSGIIQYDKDGEIVNITVGVGEDSNGYPIGISVYSKEHWSEFSFSPVDYSYEGIDTIIKTKTNGFEIAFFYYDDNQAKNNLGYDVYIAEYTIDDINFYVESKVMNEAEFEQFVLSIIENSL